MKASFLKLPIVVQGIIMTAIWTAVSMIYIWYNWPTSNFDMAPAFLPVFPVLISSKSGSVTTDWRLLWDLRVGILSGKRGCRKRKRRYLFA